MNCLAVVFEGKEERGMAREVVISRFRDEVADVVELPLEVINGKQPAFVVKSSNLIFLRATLPDFLKGLQGFVRLIDCDGILEDSARS